MPGGHYLLYNMNYREIIESRYNRKNWQELLFDIFRNKAQFWQQP